MRYLIYQGNVVADAGDTTEAELPDLVEWAIADSSLALQPWEVYWDGSEVLPKPRDTVVQPRPVGNNPGAIEVPQALENTELFITAREQAANRLAVASELTILLYADLKGLPDLKATAEDKLHDLLGLT